VYALLKRMARKLANLLLYKQPNIRGGGGVVVSGGALKQARI
jgi:hypothetical protein